MKNRKQKKFKKIVKIILGYLVIEPIIIYLAIEIFNNCITIAR